MGLVGNEHLALAIAVAAQARQGDERPRPDALEPVEALPCLPDRTVADVGDRQAAVAFLVFDTFDAAAGEKQERRREQSCKPPHGSPSPPFLNFRNELILSTLGTTPPATAGSDVS